MTVSDYKKVECDICGKTMMAQQNKDIQKRIYSLEDGYEVEEWILEQPITINRCRSGPTKLTCVTMDICPECYRKMLDRWPITDSRFGEKNKYRFTKE